MSSVWRSSNDDGINLIYSTLKWLFSDVFVNDGGAHDAIVTAYIVGFLGPVLD